MILQTDKRLIQNIRKYGCYLMCLIKTAVDRCKIEEPNADRINFYYETFLKAGWINQNCLVKSPAGILEFFGIKTRQVFATGGGVAMPSSYVSAPGEIEIICYEMPTYSHFVLPTWDPYGGSPAVKNGKISGKRIFREIKK